VRVQSTLKQETYLSLCEVEVYSVPPKVPCPQGSMSDTGYRPCTACPTGYTSKDQGSTHCVQCQYGWTTYKNNIGECNGPKLYACEHVYYNGQCKVYEGPTNVLPVLDKQISAVDVLEGDWIVYFGKDFTSHQKTVRGGWNEDDLRYVHGGAGFPVGSMNDEVRSVRPDYSKTFCYQGNGATYRGKHQTTVSGRQCQNWSEQWPHRHHIQYNETKYIAHGIGDHAYCRNPDGAGKPWCYTNELDIRWEECEIPQCVSGCAPGHYVELEQCKQCPVGTYSAGGDSVTCDTCPNDEISFAGSDSVDDCFTRRDCAWWSSDWPCDKVSGCSYGCHSNGLCWSQCNGACAPIPFDVYGTCNGCKEWCYLDSGGDYQKCSSNADCAAVRRNQCTSSCSL